MEMSKERKVKFTVPTQITGTRPLVDGCMSINFHTNELTDEDKLQVIKSLNGVGWLLFSENEIQEEEIPEGDADMQRKSQSQRIRACLFVLWKEQRRER